MIRVFIIMIFMCTVQVNAQESMDSLPYADITAAPEEMNRGSIVARMIDGLGFRYYWASEDLREEDMSHKPSTDGKSTRETLEHIHGLSRMIVNSALGKANVRPSDPTPEDWTILRKETLHNLKQASERFKSAGAFEADQFMIKFQRGDQISEVPFWNLLNGPLADAIYHTGQVVAFRRASGNPIPPGVNVFMGSRKKP